MTPDGQFRPPPRVPVSTRIMAGAVLLAVVAGSVALAAFALWVALALIPIVIGAGIVLMVMIRFKMWQASRRPGSFGSAQSTVRYRG